jgi:ABC-2 type transport system permease protein
MGFSLKNDMDTGVLESNWLAPVPRTLLLVGKTLNSLFVTAFTSSIILLFAGLLFGFRISGSVLTAFLAILPMLLGLYGFGFAFAALVLVVREANTMVDISNFLVSLLSGADFPIQSLPRWLLPVSLAIPLSYGFDAVRGILLGTKTVLPLRWELAILAGFMLIMIVTGLIAFRALERYVRQRGTLGQH